MDRMLSEITSRQFAEWLAYSRLEPWGEDRDDLRTGIVASVIANSNRGKGKKPYKPQDFMPDFEPEDEAAAIERIRESLRKSLGGKR